jgi:hypothetical protein
VQRQKKNHYEIEKSDSEKDKEARDISSSDEEKNNEDSQNLHELGNQNVNLTLSVAAMTHISHPQTLKVYGYVKNTKVTLLIDSGSSHNFINTNIARKINISIHPTSEVKVSISGNTAMSCDGKCHKVEISMSDYKLKYPMYVMPIGGVGIVLGS